MKAALPLLSGWRDQEPRERARINFYWILKLRWAAALGQLATIMLVATAFSVTLPVPQLGGILGFEAISNLALTAWFRHALDRDDTEAVFARRAERVLGCVMLLDVLLLTGLLYLTGGPDNPFALFYIVNLVLSAVVLPPSWTWGINGLVLVGYALLYLHHVPLPELAELGRGPGSDRLTLQQKGVPVAFGAAVVVVTVFVTRVTSELAAVGSLLRDEKQRRDRAERLEALGTLAAGAAHELASPLSTIAVVAKDLQISLRRAGRDDEAEEDALLIRREVERCRTILDQMSADAGQTIGEGVTEFSPAEWMESTLAELKDRERVEVAFAAAVSELRLSGPRRGLSLALRQVVKNALDVSPPGRLVPVVLSLEADGILVEVSDRGSGMEPETIARATDPFFTTKEPGKGMGLGLFLAHTVLDRVQGRITFESERGRGTVVRVFLPKERIVVDRDGTPSRFTRSQ